MRPNIIAGLDVGTSKVCAVVAESGRGRSNIIGFGVSPSRGMRKGMVVHVEETADSIRRAIREAEESSGARIRTVSVGISGRHIRGMNSTGAVGIKNKEVKHPDVDRAIEAAAAVYIPLDREVLHVIPTEFVLDGQRGITDPVGMAGVRLEARVLILTGAAASLQNLTKCCEKAGVGVGELVFKPLAAASSVLSIDEKMSGVILIDIGGGTTDIVYMKDGVMRYASVLGIGGDHLTSDLAIGFRVGIPEAERIKKTSGAAYAGMLNEGEEMKITQPGGQVKTLPRKYLVEILQPRCEEMLELVKEEIRACSGYETAVCGVVLTGGASLLSGFDKMAESMLGLPVRIGVPGLIKGMTAEAQSPAFSTAAGLVHGGHEIVPTADSRGNIVKDFVGDIKGRLMNLLSYRNMKTHTTERKGEWYV